MMLVLAAFALVSGCSQPRQLDKAAAINALTAALDAWKAGQPPQSLQSRSPPIVFGDSDWEQGTRLVNYRILRADRGDGANLHADVELELTFARGKPSRQTLTYIVGTDPILTIFRQ
jgi:hypothetical protein